MVQSSAFPLLHQYSTLSTVCLGPSPPVLAISRQVQSRRVRRVVPQHPHRHSLTNDVRSRLISAIKLRNHIPTLATRPSTQSSAPSRTTYFPAPQPRYVFWSYNIHSPHSIAMAHLLRQCPANSGVTRVRRSMWSISDSRCCCRSDYRFACVPDALDVTLTQLTYP